MNTLARTKEAPRDLSRRSAESEWLDGADASPDELALVLRDLARFNGAMLGHWPVIDWLRRATRDAPKKTALTLVDVGCGYGDLLRAIRRWARKRDLTIRLIGLDFAMKVILSIADISCWRPGSWACGASTTRATARWSA